MVENWVTRIISWLSKLFWLIFQRNCFLVINTKFSILHVFSLIMFESWVAHRATWGSCWIDRPSNGSHLATGRPFIDSTGHCRIWTFRKWLVTYSAPSQPFPESQPTYCQFDPWKLHWTGETEATLLFIMKILKHFLFGIFLEELTD